MKRYSQLSKKNIVNNIFCTVLIIIGIVGALYHPSVKLYPSWVQIACKISVISLIPFLLFYWLGFVFHIKQQN